MPRIKHQRQPRDVVTEARAAEIVAQRMLQRVNAWVNVVISVDAIITFVRGLLDEELPALAKELLRRVGIDYTDADELTIEGFQGVLSRQTGILFTDITSAQQIRADIEAHVLAKVYAATGVRFSKVDADTMRAELTTFVYDSVTAAAAGAETQATAIMGRTFASKVVRSAREAKRDGFTASLGASMSTRLRRWNHREAQKRYEKQCNVEWILEDLMTRVKVRGRVRRVATARVVASLWRYNKRKIWRPMSKGIYPVDYLATINELENYGLDWRWPIGAQQRYLTITEFNKKRIRDGLRPLKRSPFDGRKWRKGSFGES